MGRLTEPNMGSSVAFIHNSSEAMRPDVLVLSNGYELRRLNGETGALVWGGSSADER
jgi:hypothetical protein